MKRNNLDRLKFTINIPEDIYGRVLNVIETHGLEGMSAIQNMISAGLLRLKIDIIKEENTSLSSQIENLRKETKRLVEENSRLEKLCIEPQRDADYIYKRLEVLSSENEELEVLVRRQSSAEREGN